VPALRGSEALMSVNEMIDAATEIVAAQKDSEEAIKLAWGVLSALQGFLDEYWRREIAEFEAKGTLDG
jgi:hypothetical protein